MGRMSHAGMSGKAATVVVRYQVRPGRQAAFLELLARHAATLWQAGLITDQNPQYFAGTESPGRPSSVFEIFTWVNAHAAASAHAYPEVAALWQQLAALCEGDGLPVSTTVQPLELV